MKKICLYFQLHQPYRLKRYRFFDIGNDHYYYDDFRNEDIFHDIAKRCYIPANLMMLDLIKKYPEFKVTYSMSGIAIEQMEYYNPELLESFKELVRTGRVEILSETYAHSVASLYDPVEFKAQVQMHRNKINELFDVEPTVFRNTELFYSDEIGAQVKAMGYKGMITEGAKHILGWKSPNYLYNAAGINNFSLLLRNSGMSDLITSAFSRYDSPDYPLTTEKLLAKINQLREGEEFVNLFMSYEAIGVINRAESGIFDFFRALPDQAAKCGVGFATPSELVNKHHAVDQLSVIDPISWMGEEKNSNPWVGNVLQQGVITKFKEWGERIRIIQDRSLLQDWVYLQSSDHLFYMNTLNGGHNPFSPYMSPYDAFNNFMNVLSDFLFRVEGMYPSSIENEELNSLLETIKNQDLRINRLQEEIKQLKRRTRRREKVIGKL